MTSNSHGNVCWWLRSRAPRRGPVTEPSRGVPTWPHTPLPLWGRHPKPALCSAIAQGTQAIWLNCWIAKWGDKSCSWKDRRAVFCAAWTWCGGVVLYSWWKLGLRTCCRGLKAFCRIYSGQLTKIPAGRLSLPFWSKGGHVYSHLVSLQPHEIISLSSQGYKFTPCCTS